MEFLSILSEIRLSLVHGLVILLLTKLVKTSPPCNWDQITRINGNSTSCWDCPNCPAGQGLTPQCSSYVTTDVRIKCTPCKDGSTFSYSNDISSCKPCSICGPNEYTIRQCNATHNAVCGKCKPGFYREITFDCWPCTTCCPDSTDDEIEPECLKQGLPAKQSCRLNFRTEACAKKAKSTAKPKLPTSKMSEPATIDAPTSEIVINRPHTVIVVQHHYQPSSDRLWMGVGIACVMIFTVGLFCYALCKCRRRFDRRPSFSGTRCTEDGSVFIRLKDAAATNV